MKLKKTYQEKRKTEFEKKIPIGNQLDAILKAFDMVLKDGANLPYELTDIIETWLSIKEKYPKE